MCLDIPNKSKGDTFTRFPFLELWCRVGTWRFILSARAKLDPCRQTRIAAWLLQSDCKRGSFFAPGKQQASKKFEFCLLFFWLSLPSSQLCCIWHSSCSALQLNTDLGLPPKSSSTQRKDWESRAGVEVWPLPTIPSKDVVGTSCFSRVHYISSSFTGKLLIYRDTKWLSLLLALPTSTQLILKTHVDSAWSLRDCARGIYLVSIVNHLMFLCQVKINFLSVSIIIQ